MSNHRSHSWIKEKAIPFGMAMSVAIIFSPWLLIAYPWLTSHTVNLTTNDQDVVRGFIEWFGTAYSFFLALAVVNVWQQFDTVDQEFDRELDAIATLLQTVRFTKVSNRENQGKLSGFKISVKREIKEYLSHVIDNHELEQRIFEHQRNGDRILERIGERISTLTSGEVVPEPFINELFKSLNEAIDVRGDRISHSKPYTPVVVQVVSIAASVIWLLSFMALVIYNMWLAIFLIGGVAFVIIMVLVIFFDLSEPFGGIWQIHLDGWKEYLHIIDHDEDPQVIFIYKLQSSLPGWFRLVTRRETCKLYDFANSKACRNSWKRFWESIQRKRPDGYPAIACQSLYYDQLKHNGLPLSGVEWPIVVLKRGGNRKILLNSEQIDGCTDLSAFEALFHDKMKKHLNWYEQ